MASFHVEKRKEKKKKQRFLASVREGKAGREKRREKVDRGKGGGGSRAQVKMEKFGYDKRFGFRLDFVVKIPHEVVHEERSGVP